jgi:hypothetical protein
MSKNVKFECQCLWQSNIRYQKKKQENINILSIQMEQKECKNLPKHE